MDGALAETKEAISPPSGTTAFPWRSINVTRVRVRRAEADEDGRKWGKSIYKYHARTAGPRDV